MLIKKTIVILDEIKTIGHLSIIRVGQDTGAKLSLVKAMDGYLLIKLSGSKQECFEITGSRMEIALEGALNSNDLIGVLVVDERGEIKAKGGRAEIVNPQQVSEILKADEVEEEKSLDVNSEETQTTFDALADAVEENPKDDYIEEVEDTQSGETVAENTVEMKSIEEEVEAESESTPPPFSFVKGENFYKNVMGKLSEIMTVNPREDRLEALIPDSKWVKVYYDKDEYYVVGILSDEGDVKFLAYGVPGVKSVKPPKDAEELCDFLEVKGALSEGYWIMFQNAKNGEIVKSIE